MQRIGIIFTFPILTEKRRFLTHIPIRIKGILGDEVEVFAIYGGELDEEILRTNGVCPVFVPCFGKMKRIMLLVNIPLLFALTVKICKRYRFDAVLNANNHIMMFPVALACRLCGVRSIARVAGELIVNKGVGIKNTLLFYYLRIIEKLSFKTVNSIICLSQSLKTMVLNKSKVADKSTVISQGVNTNMFYFNEYNLESKLNDRLIFIGRIESNKRVDLILDAYSTILEKGYYVVFDIYGDGKNKIDLKNKYEHLPGVKFHGEIEHSEVPRVLEDGGILVLFSKSEGLPNTILEAMASGILVIASNVGEIPALLGYGSRGIIVESGDVEQMAKSIIYVLENRELMIDLIKNACSYVKNKHSFKSLRHKYKKILFS